MTGRGKTDQMEAEKKQTNVYRDSSTEQYLAYEITEEIDAGKRIDKYLSEKLADWSRSSIQKHIRDGNVYVNQKTVKSGYKTCQGDIIEFYIKPPAEPDILPENIPLDILYEDDDIIVINKPKQMVVHPAPGHYSGTLVNALMYHCKDSLSGINGVIRPGIVHRIDQDTTGAIVVCKNDYAHQKIAEQLKEHSITRTYHAIVLHNLSKRQGTIEGSIGRHPIDRKKMAMNVKNGKPAITHYQVLDDLNHNLNYIECHLETGRTHQIRVHMAGIGHPVLGDTVYGPSKLPSSICHWKLTGQTLHAKTLGFIHPTTNQYIEFDAPLPQYFVKILHDLQQ